MTIVKPSDWSSFYQLHPEAHFLQSESWAIIKSKFGWNCERICSPNAAALVLFRKLPMGFTIGYIPKGPLGDQWDELWPELDKICWQKRCIFLKVEPDAWEPIGSELRSYFHGFIQSKPIQPRRTVVINLVGSEDLWLSVMKQKTRYNIRLAEKKEITISQTTDIEVFFQLMQMTGERDGFGIHNKEYYQAVLNSFRSSGEVAILTAYFSGQPLGALMVVAHGKRAWYLYGASNDVERNRMPTYLLQWEAMKWAAGKGCRTYDLWGVPDFDSNFLEDQFEKRADGLWGVYRFKRGFGGSVVRSVGAWDKVYRPLLYQFYVWWSNRRGSESAL